jgi:hypothetical protein
MTAKVKIAHRKLSLLELAEKLNNISEACRLMSYSRSQFYEIKRSSSVPLRSIISYAVIT